MSDSNPSRSRNSEGSKPPMRKEGPRSSGQAPKKFDRKGPGKFSDKRNERFPKPQSDNSFRRPPRKFSDKREDRFPQKGNRGPVDEISPFIKKLARLKMEKNRLEFSQFLLEGKKLIRDVVEISPDIVMDVYVSEDFDDQSLITYLKEKRLRIKKITAPELKYLSDVGTPQGIIAQCKFSNLRIDWAKCQYITLLDGIQDPGNLGSIFRTSLALGSQAMVLGKGTCDAYNPKVVRSSACAFLSLPFEAGADLKSKVKFLRQKGFTILAATPHSPTPVTHPKLRKKVALIVGNEGSGIEPGLLSQADEEITIPHFKDVESLNVAVAHGIILHSLISGRKHS